MVLTKGWWWDDIVDAMLFLIDPDASYTIPNCALAQAPSNIMPEPEQAAEAHAVLPSAPPQGDASLLIPHRALAKEPIINAPGSRQEADACCRMR